MPTSNEIMLERWPCSVSKAVDIFLLAGKSSILHVLTPFHSVVCSAVWRYEGVSGTTVGAVGFMHSRGVENKYQPKEGHQEQVDSIDHENSLFGIPAHPGHPAPFHSEHLDLTPHPGLPASLS